MRVLSLSPAATEWLHAFGAGGLLVEGDDPAALRPDLVVTEGDSLPEGLEAEVYPFVPQTFKQTLDAALGLAQRVGHLREAMAFLAEAERDLAALRARIGALRDGSLDGRPAPRVACLVGPDPLAPAGRWVPDLIRLAGGHPLGPEPGEASAPVLPSDLQALDPDVLLLALSRLAEPSRQLLSEGDPSEASAWEGLRAVEAGRAWTLAEGLLDRPGPGLYRAIEAFAAACHPERVPRPDPCPLAPLRDPLPV
jgi:ABC-type Fe3+-hydroxamate transport system substrate-binding protein